jgi:GNAT superfamily N-acetyltransferase
VRNLNAVYVGEARETDLLAVYVDGDDPEPPGPDWEHELGVFMAHRGAPPAPDPRVQEVERSSLLGLRREWLEEEVPLPEIIEQLVVSDERLFGNTPTRAYTIDGAAMTLLLGDGPVMMVEDVYTTVARRREGLASALVRTAVATAYADGAELVFLPTAAGGPAQRLYASLGFEDIAHTSMFFRPA